MGVKRGQILELGVSDMAFGGHGLAEKDGFVIFIRQTMPGAVPGDRVAVQVFKKKKKFAEARVVELIDPSPYRVAPPCPYSGHCGGCKWQFVRYDKQLVYKQRHVADALRHIGLLEDIRENPVIPCDRIFGYRNKMEFSCSDRRWLLPAEMNGKPMDTGFALGLHVPGTFHKVLDIDACLLQPGLGNRILADVRAYIRQSKIPVYGLRSHVGFWRFLMLRHSVSRDQWMVNIITADQDRRTVQPLADQLLDKYPRVISVVNNINTRKAGIAVGEHEIRLAGDSLLREHIGALQFQISANSFFQTNTRGAEQLYRVVKTYAELSGHEAVVDLYCGTGTIALFLAGAAETITGFEITESAVEDARANCRLNRISNCRFVAGDIRKSFPGAGKPPDVMIIDPPRVGMHKDVVKQVLESGPGRVVYVSCNPPTLARDLSLMKDRYRVVAVQPVDMFPHTHHIEVVAKLARKG